MGRSSLGVLALVALAVGCAGDQDLAEVLYTAQSDDVSARVWIPVNEPRSAGTYRGEVVWSDGTRHAFVAERDGMLGDVWLADLDEDGAPELIVTQSSAGSGSYGTADVYGYRGGALVDLGVAPLADEQRSGYMGHDTFRVEGGSLYRSYPVYAGGDTNVAPTGGRSTFRYLLADSMWVAAPGDSS